MQTKKRKIVLKKQALQMENNNPIPITAAGGVVYKNEESIKKVLLIKRNGFWDIPKGKIEDGESIEECANREVQEEVGANGLSIERFLCDTYHTYHAEGRTFGKTTHWYLMKFDHSVRTFTPEIKEGITEVKWEEINRAKEMVEFQNLVDVLNELE